MLCAESKFDRMVAHVVGPRGHPCTKALLIVGKQRSKGFFEAGHVSCDRCYEVISSFLRLAPSVGFRMRASGFLNQFAQGNRGAAGLCGKPFPMAWQQRDFARYYAEFWPPATTGLFNCSVRLCRIVGAHGLIASATGQAGE